VIENTSPHLARETSALHRTAERPRLRLRHTCILLITLQAACFAFVGSLKSLPFAPENDEARFVRAAGRMVVARDLDPQWFGHPGSTVIYPLAVLYALPGIIPGVGYHWLPTSDLLGEYQPGHARFYLIGRLMSIAYFVATIPLVYILGRDVFGWRAGLIGAWFSSIVPLAVSHAQVVRTDSAATFFGVFALVLCLRLLDFPTLRNQMTAAFVIGLAIATRYFMISLLAAFVVANLVNLRTGRLSWMQLARFVATGIAIALPAFLISTPYFVLDVPAVRRDLLLEAEPTHLGADGLSFFGNLAWYFFEALTNDLTLPLAFLAAIGLGMIARNHNSKQTVLAMFAFLFLVVISSSSLHWHRWTIQVIPLFCLFAAHALDVIVERAAIGLGHARNARGAMLATAAVLLPALALYQLVRHDRQQLYPTTSVRAREWLLRNAPAGSKIVSEQYGAPLAATPFVGEERYSLATSGGLRSYCDAGYRFIIVSSALYSRYLAEPQRYRSETAFYEELFSMRLLATFSPPPHWSLLPATLARDCVCSLSQTSGPPTISVYEPCGTTNRQ
jgi:hypothetical protein